MKISCKKYRLVFVTNLVNHHQIPVADCFYKVLGDNYLYISLEPLPQWLKNGGYQEISRPYIACLGVDGFTLNDVKSIVDEADIVIIGAAPHFLTHDRQKSNKITFHYSERWFKDGYYHLLSPKLWFIRYKDYIRFRNKRTFMLCASAFTATDTKKMFCFPNKTYKWGYFTQVPRENLGKILEAKQGASRLRILYVSRFLVLKHPELPVEVARILKARGIDFELNMYGSGELLEKIAALIQRYNLQDCVHLKGNLPNPEILEQMKQHHIFLFTSDRNEGWGAVLNEAMSNGCAVVASDKIGSAPFLIRNMENGLLFKSNDLKSLASKVLYLANNPTEITRLGTKAYFDIKNIWSPENAAEKFLQLAEGIEAGNFDVVNGYGPCTKA